MNGRYLHILEAVPLCTGIIKVEKPIYYVYQKSLFNLSVVLRILDLTRTRLVRFLCSPGPARPKTPVRLEHVELGQSKNKAKSKFEDMIYDGTMVA